MKVEILSGLWISSFSELNKTNIIINKNIHHIINCSSTNIDNYISKLNEKYNNSIKNTYLPIKDTLEKVKSNSLLLVDNMNDITNIIYKTLHENKNILIMCDSGTQTSLTIAICYLIRFGKIDIDYARNALYNKCELLDYTRNRYNYSIKQYYINLKNNSN